LPLLGGRQVCELDPAAKPVARRKKLAFEPSMFRATPSQDRERVHRAPVEKTSGESMAQRRTKSKYYFSLLIRHKAALRF